MANSKPDFINATLGAAFGSVAGPIVERLIAGVQYVHRCREQCKELGKVLEELKPIVEVVSKCQDSEVIKKWVDGFEELLKEAESIVEVCRSESSGFWARCNEIQYGHKILKLQECILKKASQSSIIALAATHAKNTMGPLNTLQFVPDKIFGMDDHFKKVQSSILNGDERRSSRCVSVQGMGGAGKTLLAQMVNNDKKIGEVFGRESIFWISVGHDASISSIYKLMRNYLHVGSWDGSLIDQRTHLSNEFICRRVLLILDDVWDNVYEHEEMVEWLNIARGPGSVTLITTRLESITYNCVNGGVEVILGLSEEHSWQLFRTHAFGEDTLAMDKNLEGMARNVCKECRGLPLALKVVGRAMKAKHDIVEWRRILQRLQASTMVNKSVEEQIFQRLKISYDDLDGPTKRCFLYFAAFPEDCAIYVKDLCHMWVVEGLFGEDLTKMEALVEAQCAIKELRRRYLIDACDEKCYRGKRVRMHDILRDLAMDLSREGEEHARENLFKLDNKDLKEFPSSWLRSPLKAKRMSIWGNNITNFPSTFRAPDLRVCILYPVPWMEKNSKDENSVGEDSNHQETTIEEKFFKSLNKLKYFALCRNGSLMNIPNSIGELQSLHHLNLNGCHALEELPESIGGLGPLQHLDLSRCYALKELLESIGGLGSLQHLDLSRCHALKELPESIGGLGSLQYLDLEYCVALKELPESIGGLGSLQHLDLSECDALKELPKSFGGLGSLQHLDLSWCRALKELPESIGGLGSLQHLDLKHCDALKEFPESFGALGSLQHLNLKFCVALKELPESIGGLGSLQYLDLEYCVALKELPESIGGLGSLQHLNLSRCYALKELPESIGGLESLQHLYFRGWHALKELPESIGGLGSLQHLDLYECSRLEELPKSIGGLGSLQHLDLSWWHALKELPESIGGLGSLQHLDLKFCDALKELPESIGGLGSLQHLNLSRCCALKELPESIGGLESLQHLDLEYCVALKELPESIGGLGSLQHLNLSRCHALKELPESIGGLESLQHLYLREWHALKELPESIGGLGSLQHLDLYECSRLEELPKSIGGLGSLQRLNVKGCGALKVFPEFANTMQLQILCDE